MRRVEWDRDDHLNQTRREIGKSKDGMGLEDRINLDIALLFQENGS